MKIKERIKQANLFLFLATKDSTASRWCPWEIGYADGVKSLSDIFIVPTRDDDGTSRGNEYLQLYKKIDLSAEGRLAGWEPGATRGVLVSGL